MSVLLRSSDQQFLWCSGGVRLSELAIVPFLELAKLRADAPQVEALRDEVAESVAAATLLQGGVLSIFSDLRQGRGDLHQHVGAILAEYQALAELVPLVIDEHRGQRPE